MKTVSTTKAPEAIGPYSQAKIINGFVFCSGQIPINPATGAIDASSIADQTRQACLNVKALLEAAGSSLEKVIKTTCFLANMDDFAAFNSVYAEYFTGKPARSCVAVKDIPKGALCEIEVIAEA
ncbi:MAG: RidA family protein [Treponema sp.]|nr:RidA family protein [Treponema sp.]MBR4386095.1 RidA family protein [Treponema sp.]